MKWLLLAKPWLLPAGLLLVGAAVGGSWFHGYQTGKSVTQADQLQAIEDLRERAGILADELEAERAKRRSGTRVEIRYVDRAPDPSGCLDAAVVDDRMFDTLGGVPGG